MEEVALTLASKFHKVIFAEAPVLSMAGSALPTRKQDSGCAPHTHSVGLRITAM